MTGLECLKAEMLKRGFTKSQVESKTVIGVLEIIAGSEGRYTDLDRLQKEIESAKKTLAEYQRGVIEQRAKYEWFKANNKVNMETVRGWANAIVEETLDEEMAPGVEAVPLAEWKELKDRLQLIADIAVDYDGYRTAEDLMSLIDEIREIALYGIPKEAS